MVICAQDNIDACWPAHDACDSIDVNETKYNLTNTEDIKVFNCECELEFYHCLRRVNSRLANRLGEVYFLLQRKCFRKTYPIFDCKYYDAIEGKSNSKVLRCIQYTLVLNEPKVYQWFDTPYYKGKLWKSPTYMIRDGKY